jgi:hypothetical protein
MSGLHSGDGAQAHSTARSSFAPVTLKVTRTDRRFAEISDPLPSLSGERMSVAAEPGSARRALVTSWWPLGQRAAGENACGRGAPWRLGPAQPHLPVALRSPGRRRTRAQWRPSGTPR